MKQGYLTEEKTSLVPWGEDEENEEKKGQEE